MRVPLAIPTVPRHLVGQIDGRQFAVPLRDEPGGRGGYAQPPAGLQFQPALDAPLANLDATVEGLRGADSAYGAGIVNLPRSCVLLFDGHWLTTTRSIVRCPRSISSPNSPLRCQRTPPSTSFESMWVRLYLLLF